MGNKELNDEMKGIDYEKKIVIGERIENREKEMNKRLKRGN